MSALINSILVVPSGISATPANVLPAVLQRGLFPVTENSRADDVAMISHELRNSLGVMMQAARLMKLRRGPDDIDRALVLIDRHVLQMSRLIEDLLDATPLKLHKNALRLTHLDLRTTVQNSIDAIASDLARRRHALRVTLPPEAVWMHVDGARLEQVFANLLNNAAKYTPEGGQISLTMERLDQHVSICVRDSGIGIAPALLLPIFEMFAQVDAIALVSEGGRGIGLAVVRDLVKMHGGSVTATSAGLNLGSEFTVLLPALWTRTDERLADVSAV
jgi:two-component system CheB/CheR fusion protein